LSRAAPGSCAHRRLAVFGFSLFGDAVRDELDPKLRSR
jgi:ABC-type dipeptide/oligopeptide/nickel transport system permease subunit